MTACLYRARLGREWGLAPASLAHLLAQQPGVVRARVVRVRWGRAARQGVVRRG